MQDTGARYRSERQRLAAGVEEVRRLALTGALRTSRLRSVAWAILLGALPPDADRWLESTRANRQHYELIRANHGRDPRTVRYCEDDPLSQNDGSLWNQHFADADLRATIRLDVVRTFPGVEFFKQTDVQEAMIEVLFCFAREHPRLLYRQGMHEILAPILFVLQCDHRAAEHSDSPGILSEELAEIVDSEYLEHDAYTMFKAIMYGIEKFYRADETPPMSPSLPEEASNVPTERKRIEVEVVRYLNDIRDNLLIQHDPELTDHFQKCDISLTLFGVRWLRVLFGREFTLHDLLVLWDAMFAEAEDFSLAGFVLVAMLLAIRVPLMNKDPMVCLTYLMHYPTSVDVQYIIEHALFLKHPNQYCMPTVRSFNFALPKSTASMLSRKHRRSNARSNAISNLKVGSSVDDNGIVDGVSLREWENLNDELVHAHSVMSLCSLKLEKYEEIIRQSLPPTLQTSHPTYQALGGIKELCRLLNTRHHRPPDIEPALEADEFPKVEDKRRLKKGLDAARSANMRSMEENRVPAALSSAKEVQLKVFNLVKSEDAVSGAPSDDPLGIHGD